MGYRKEDENYDRQQDQAQRLSSIDQASWMMLDHLMEMRKIMERWEEREKAKEAPTIPYTSNPHPSLNSKTYAQSPVEKCRRCGATGYAQDEFLNYWTGLCPVCHNQEQEKQRNENPSSLDPEMEKKEEKPTEINYGRGIGDSTIGFPVYSGRQISITTRLEINMPKSFMESLYETVLWCRSVSNVRFKANARYYFNEYEVDVIHVGGLEIEFYAFILNTNDKTSSYQYCLYQGVDHWKLVSMPGSTIMDNGQ